MNYTPEQLLTMPDAERDALAAEVMGWTFKEASLGYGHHTYMAWFDEQGNEYMWQPSKPTEKGKAQCWELMMRFNLSLRANYGGVFYAVIDYVTDETILSGIDECNAQKVSVTAAILAAQAEKEGLI